MCGHLHTSNAYVGDKVLHKTHAIKSLPTAGYDESNKEPQAGDQMCHTNEPESKTHRMRKEDMPRSSIVAVEPQSHSLVCSSSSQTLRGIGSHQRISPFTVTFPRQGSLLNGFHFFLAILEASVTRASTAGCMATLSSSSRSNMGSAMVPESSHQ